MVRYARSSRIDKNQVTAYVTEPQFGLWRNRVYVVLGHPPPTRPSLPISDAESYLRCIALEDVCLHIATTSRGTINSDLLAYLENAHRPSAIMRW